MEMQVVKHTNNRARWDLRAKGQNPNEWGPVDLCEIRVLLVYCTSLLCIVLNTNRFARCGYLVHTEGLYFLLLLAVITLTSFVANLRFDSREDRNTDDKFAPFRRMWEQFV